MEGLLDDCKYNILKGMYSETPGTNGEKDPELNLEHRAGEEDLEHNTASWLLALTTTTIVQLSIGCNVVSPSSL